MVQVVNACKSLCASLSLSGEVFVDGNSVSRSTVYSDSFVIGNGFRQESTAQLVCATVFDEVAFGPALGLLEISFSTLLRTELLALPI